MRIEEHEVRGERGLEAHLGQPEHAPRSLGPQLEGSLEREAPGLHQLGDREPQRGLQPDDPERRLIERLPLVFERVRRMVGGETVDGPVPDCLDRGVAIALGA